jgi:hypothetical protein
MRRPRLGDQVRIDGFLGVFEIVRVDRNGLMVDLKHVGRHGSDYIEKEILTRELTYVDVPRTAVPIDGRATGNGHATASGNGHANGSGDAKTTWPANGTENSKSTVNY